MNAQADNRLTLRVQANGPIRHELRHGNNVTVIVSGHITAETIRLNGNQTHRTLTLTGKPIIVTIRDHAGKAWQLHPEAAQWEASVQAAERRDAAMPQVELPLEDGER